MMHDDNVAREAVTGALAVVEAMYASERTTNRVGIVPMRREAESGKKRLDPLQSPRLIGPLYPVLIFHHKCIPVTCATRRNYRNVRRLRQAICP